MRLVSLETVTTDGVVIVPLDADAIRRSKDHPKGWDWDFSWPPAGTRNWLLTTVRLRNQILERRSLRGVLGGESRGSSAT